VFHQWRRTAGAFTGGNDGASADEEGDLIEVCEEGDVSVFRAVGVVGEIVVVDLGHWV
jgi:hypothetical protein